MNQILKDRIDQIIEKYQEEIKPVSRLYFDSTFTTDIEESSNKPKIRFIKKFAGDYLKTAKDECILNFASAKRAGGGVLSGSIAQEEDICRNSLLYLYLKQFTETHYGNGLFKIGIFYQNFIIFSKDVPTVDKNLNTTFNNSYITSAAPNLSSIDNYDKQSYAEIFNTRIKGVLAVAHQNNCKNITLGTWGCGVFKNNPKKVANYFKDNIDLYGGNFDRITFLIPDDKNYEIFKNILK